MSKNELIEMLRHAHSMLNVFSEVIDNSLDGDHPDSDELSELIEKISIALSDNR